ncbi:gamma-glutamyltransferase [Radiomyces spectabilis]|uniref:gamma-glutamyltransferase n=1 Tax=Radiomyces spectabilis TaxID=64574 RepID=UPI00221FAC55|nr:gamma-glutamyltransferase [Radiomyces spectabilis]KAI8373067.1 gamma-glutamyltransferase [Radiomyces spectabilis]
MVLDKGFHGHMVEGTQGAVAVEAQECSDVGVDILKQGGNAVDAAIASALCIGVINSFATGGFMLIRAPNGTFEFIDFRETAPAASHKDMFVDDPSLAKYGGMSVGVPGEIRGFELAHQRHGKLPWETLFQPAIRMAREGFRTTRYLNEKLQSSLPWIEDEWEWAEIFAPKGSIAEIDDIIKRPNLAQTLETIAKQGADAFYEGPIAQAIVNATRQAGGILTEDDMRNYKALIREPVSTFYHGRKVITGPAPTSGPVLLSMLNVIERYNLASKGPTPVNLHRIIETMKFGAAFRTELGDPQWTHNQDRLDEIISKDWAARVRTNLTDDTTHDPLYYQPKYDHLESPGTMHLSVVDRDDGAVALTSTVNLLFGSRVMDPVTGVVLNDEMDDFSIPSVPNAFGLYPSYHNYAAPGKRPLSSTTPTIIELDNRFEMALGGSGGSQIVTASLDVKMTMGKVME